MAIDTSVAARISARLRRYGRSSSVSSGGTAATSGQRTVVSRTVAAIVRYTRREQLTAYPPVRDGALWRRQRDRPLWRGRIGRRGRIEVPGWRRPGQRVVPGRQRRPAVGGRRWCGRWTSGAFEPGASGGHPRRGTGAWRRRRPRMSPGAIPVDPGTGPEPDARASLRKPMGPRGVPRPVHRSWISGTVGVPTGRAVAATGLLPGASTTGRPGRGVAPGRLASRALGFVRHGGVRAAWPASPNVPRPDSPHEPVAIPTRVAGEVVSREGVRSWVSRVPGREPPPRSGESVNSSAASPQH